MTIGDRIKKKREELGISQTELAKAISVSKQTLYKYENNIVTNIPSDKIEEISKILDISPTYIMGWNENYYLGSELQHIFEILSAEYQVPSNELIRAFFSKDFSSLLPSQKVISLENMRNALDKYFSETSDIHPTNDEVTIIAKYRNLDDHGRDMVDTVLDKEWQRSIAERKTTAPISITEARANKDLETDAANQNPDATPEQTAFDDDVMDDPDF